MSGMEISRGALILCIVVLAAAALVAVGYTLSPRVAGRPVWLSLANWQLTRYLDRAGRWLLVLEEEGERLADMISSSASAEGELPQPPTPSGMETVYQRSRTLERSLARLAAVRQEMEQAEAPQPLQALHALALATADECLGLHNAVATALGSPSRGSQATAQAQAQTAADHLLALRRALQAQLAFLEREAPTPVLSPVEGPVLTPAQGPAPAGTLSPPTTPQVGPTARPTATPGSGWHEQRAPTWTPRPTAAARETPRRFWIPPLRQWWEDSWP